MLNTTIHTIKSIINILQKKPVLVVFDVTKKCTQNCIMCNIKTANSDDMSLDEIEKKASILKKFGIYSVFLQGGEPLLRKDILSIVDVFIKHNITPTIITNGELLSNNIIYEIAKRKCNLSISIDSFEPEIYSYIRGKNSLNLVKNNIKVIKEIKPKGIFSITSTITSKSTLEDIIEISKYAEELNIQYLVRPYNANLNIAGAKIDNLEADKEKYIEIFSYFKKNSKNIFLKIIYKNLIDYFNGKKLNSCDALNYSLMMNEKGEFAPCIERNNMIFNIENFKNYKKEVKNILEECNKNTPCIYGCTRNHGFIISNLHLLLFQFKI